jgi:hypothetical protein
LRQLVLVSSAVMTDRVKTYWRGLVIAAAVSFRQVGALPDSDRLRESHPYVLIHEQADDAGFVMAERVGRTILTEPLDTIGPYSPN